MQSGFNAKAQRGKGAKVETEIDFRKTKVLFSALLRRQSDPVILRVFAPWRLCVKEFNGLDTAEGGTPNGDASLPTTFNPQPRKGAWPPRGFTPSTLNRLGAFTLVEILVVVVLMSLIVLALMAVFNSTQAAFRASITQTDVLEGGRSVMGLIKNDLESLTPSYLYPANPSPNFYAAVSNSFPQTLTGSTASRTNIMEDVFFITRQNQTWKGVGYFVRTNLLLAGGIATPGILYRFETNNSAADFARASANLFSFFNGVRNPVQVGKNNSTLPVGVSQILAGVMSFKVRAYDTNGFWITAGRANFVAITNVTSPEVILYAFYSNAVPAAVEVELGVLEDHALQRVQSLGGVTQSNYLAQQAGKVHVFRQRFPIRNVDPSAYQ